MARRAKQCDNREMPRKKRNRAPSRREAKAPEFANRPFRTLPVRPKAAPQAKAAPVVAAADDGCEPDAFADAMRGVRRLDDRQRAVVPPPKRQLRPRPIEGPNAEALAALSDLVSGGGEFDITDTTEFIEGAVTGVDRRLVRRLRRGDFAFRRHLDLHGMTVEQAREAVTAFLRAAIRDGERCVLLIHGRGLNSPERVPVLKRNLLVWLSRGAWARSVLAFASARPCDGGAGALYVLLRRVRNQRKQIDITEGGKW